eukprot:GHRR01037463.1.p1 GENE.GHRR01037463.1~~GHRR01037463.1.p1  ORF type:complete len:175 (-),score=43.09 GHRR01037463.1:73-597(-)
MHVATAIAIAFHCLLLVSAVRAPSKRARQHDRRIKRLLKSLNITKVWMFPLIMFPSVLFATFRRRCMRSLVQDLFLTSRCAFLQVIPRLNPSYHPNDTYVSSDRQRLLLRLDMYALQERQITGDGNCQFRAIADQLYFRQDLHGLVRQQVVAQLCKQPEQYKPFVATDYQQYIK